MMTYGTTLRNVDDVRGRAYSEIMDILRPLDWLDRAAVCETLMANGEWCIWCGKAQPDSTSVIVQCKRNGGRRDAALY